MAPRETCRSDKSSYHGVGLYDTYINSLRVCYFVLPTGGGHDSSSGRLLFGARAAELSTQNAARRNSFVGDQEEIRGRFSSSRQRPHVPAYLRHKFA